MLDEGKESVSTLHTGKSQKRTQNSATWGHVGFPIVKL